MTNCAFTIVAKNYIGLALILEKSIRLYCDELDFYIVVADEFDKESKLGLPHNVIVAKDVLGINSVQWNNMSFKYNITEFCTAIKPFSFDYLFEKFTYDKVIYLDPDIYFYDSIGIIFKYLEGTSILLTPHITHITKTPKSDSPEKIWHSCGIFNLGFCGLRRTNSSQKMIDWWMNRLTDGCYIDMYDQFYTDQKWLDFIPSLFDNTEYTIIKHLGMNLAPWNFFERRVVKDEGKLYVESRFDNESKRFPIIFVHYSGYNYIELKKGSVIQQNIPQLTNYTDIMLLTSAYAEAINQHNLLFDSYISQSYSYNNFENGDIIESIHRRLYRSLLAKGEIINLPFSVGAETYHDLLRKSGMITMTKINIDKVNKTNLVGIDRKLKMFNQLMKIIYKIMGYQRYLLLIRLLRPFSRYESQIFLINKKYKSNNI